MNKNGIFFNEVMII